MGYNTIETEYTIQTNNTYYRVDVFAKNIDGKTLAIECGNLTGNESVKKLVTFCLFFDRFIWMPYITTKTVDSTELLNEIINSEVAATIGLNVTKTSLQQEILIITKIRDSLKDDVSNLLNRLNPENYNSFYEELKKTQKEVLRDSERLNYYVNDLYIRLEKLSVTKPRTEAELILSRKIHLGR